MAGTVAAFDLHTYFAVGNYCGYAAYVRAVSASVGASSAGTRGTHPGPPVGGPGDPREAEAPCSAHFVDGVSCPAACSAWAWEAARACRAAPGPRRARCSPLETQSLYVHCIWHGRWWGHWAATGPAHAWACADCYRSWGAACLFEDFGILAACSSDLDFCSQASCVRVSLSSVEDSVSYYFVTLPWGSVVVEAPF